MLHEELELAYIFRQELSIGTPRTAEPRSHSEPISIAYGLLELLILLLRYYLLDHILGSVPENNELIRSVH